MSANSINQYSLSTCMARYGPDQQKLKPVIEGLEEIKNILADAPVHEAEFIDQEWVNRRISLPAPYWHKIGEGLTGTVGQTQPVMETMGMLRNQMRINEEFLSKQGDPDGFIAQEKPAFLEGMAQELENTLIYGTTGATPEEFDGLDIRYPSIAANSVIDNGGSTASNMTKIWLIQWHPTECCMIYPKGGQGGVRTIDKGTWLLSTETDATGSVESTKAQAFFHLINFEWDGGLCVKDPRRIKCMGNIHQTVGNANAFKIEKFRQAKNAFRTGGQIYAYMHPDMRNQIEGTTDEKVNVTYPPSQPFSVDVPYLLNIPLRTTEAILLTGNQMT